MYLVIFFPQCHFKCTICSTDLCSIVIYPCSVGHETKISLYQLIFSDKIPSSHQPATLYHNLQSCVLRLEYPLTSTPSTPNACSSVGSCLLNCFTVQLYHQVRGLEESSEGPSKCGGIVLWVRGFCLGRGRGTQGVQFGCY